MTTVTLTFDQLVKVLRMAAGLVVSDLAVSELEVHIPEEAIRFAVLDTIEYIRVMEVADGEMPVLTVEDV